MSINSGYIPTLFVDLLGNTDAARNLRGANVFFIDSTTAQPVEVDAVTLTIEDSEGTTQAVLYDVSVPPVVFDDVSGLYSVDSIDVSGYPSGDITLNWEGTLDGYSYTSTQTVNYQSAPSMVFVNGYTQSVNDYKVVLGQAKTLTIKLQDALSNPITTASVRAGVLDYINGGVVEYFSASLVSAGTGIWSFTNTFNSGTYTSALRRYELFWEVNIASQGYTEVLKSRTPLEVYGTIGSVTTGNQTNCSNQQIRETFPNIDELLTNYSPNQAERELILNRARVEASILINENFKNTRHSKNVALLEILEVYSVYRDLLLKSHSFANFAINDGQLKLLNTKIAEIYNKLNGTIGLRIGPRGYNTYSKFVKR